MKYEKEDLHALNSKFSSDFVRSAVEQVVGRIAPMWPLHSFVAVNPFLGFADKTFDETVIFFKRVNRVNLLLAPEFYLQRRDSGELTKEAIAHALSKRGLKADDDEGDQLLTRLMNISRDELASLNSDTADAVVTISEILDRLAMGNRQISLTDFMIQEIAKFCALYFDLGQAQSQFPFRDLSLYKAWRAYVGHDKSPSIMGLSEFEKVLSKTSSDPIEAISFVLTELGIPIQSTEEYLYRALFDIKGWASYVRHLVWKEGLSGKRNDCLIELLAIRVLWGYALYYHQKDSEFRNEWRSQILKSTPSKDRTESIRKGIDHLLTFQEAFEWAQSASIFRKLLCASPEDKYHCGKSSGETAPLLQAVFCIDVRSEPFRLSLEAVGPRIETFGVAGFFGVPFKFKPLSKSAWSVDHAPALIESTLHVHESSRVDSVHREDSGKSKTTKASAWFFKTLSTSGFSFVESFGVMSIGQLITKAIGLSKLKSPTRLSPLRTVESGSNLLKSVNVKDRAQLAAHFLKSIDLTKKFSPIVLLVGHGSESVNNAHAAGLECGACGGHSGDLNAQVMSSILNDRECRLALAEAGIEIPSHTIFLPALHNTTSDEVQIIEEPIDSASWSSGKDFVRESLRSASKRSRESRVEHFVNDAVVDKADELPSRGRDWSQVRPEWGLAGNSFFIVAPRDHTRSIDLKGKSFLHSYNWKDDEGFKILEQIMTAPMIVTNWINLQYFASAAQPEALGAGNKTIHNVIGKLGVVEGNSGDLKIGLSHQSVHDGKEVRHLPLRLNVVIAAPREAIAHIVQKHESVKNLVHNKWLHLFSQLERGQPIFEYAADANGLPHWLEVKLH